jgi:hypothetical protein
VDAPEATPGSDTPPGADVSSAASNGQRGRGGGRGGGRGAGGRGGRGPRPEPTVKPEDIVVDAEFTGTVVCFPMLLHCCLELPFYPTVHRTLLTRCLQACHHAVAWSCCMLALRSTSHQELLRVLPVCLIALLLSCPPSCTQRSVQAYGAFVDFGGASHGLVHISQISVRMAAESRRTSVGRALVEQHDDVHGGACVWHTDVCMRACGNSPPKSAIAGQLHRQCQRRCQARRDRQGARAERGGREGGAVHEVQAVGGRDPQGPRRT